MSQQFLEATRLLDSTITANKIANANVNSSKLASNLSISIVNALETANIFSTAVGGNVNIDVLNNTVYFFSSNTTANVTFNLRGNNITTLQNTLSIGRSVSVAILLKQGANTFKSNVYIDGTLVSPFWAANSAPNYVTGTNESIDLYALNVIKTGDSSYTVLGSNTKFGSALGQ
jgi:hypothetical protein